MSAASPVVSDLEGQDLRVKLCTLGNVCANRCGPAFYCPYDSHPELRCECEGDAACVNERCEGDAQAMPVPR